MKNTKKYGALNIKVMYAIAIFDNNNCNKLKFVTEVDSNTKTFKFEPDKKAWFTSSREYAEDLSSAMLINMYPAFVVEIPEVAENYYDNFVNTKNEKE